MRSQTKNSGYAAAAMGRRTLQFRVAFATLGVIALLLGALLDVLWLAGAGALAAGVSDVTGILQAHRRFPEPAMRTLRGACEALPALGVAAFEPGAINIAVVVVVYAVMAAGMATVCESRSLTLGHIRGETTRRVLTRLCSLCALGIPVLGVLGQSPKSLLGRDSASIVVVIVAVATLVSVRGLLDIALEIRRAGSSKPVQNVDT
jgi:hypothetical protein